MKKILLAIAAVVLVAVSCGGPASKMNSMTNDAIDKIEKATSAEELTEIHAKWVEALAKISKKTADMAPEELKELNDKTKETFTKYHEVIRAKEKELKK